MISPFDWLHCKNKKQTKKSLNISLLTLTPMILSCLNWGNGSSYAMVDVRPICGPCHHKGSKPLLETTMQSQMILMTSSWDVPVCSNMAATVSYILTWQLLCYSCTLQFWFLSHSASGGPLCVLLSLPPRMEKLLIRYWNKKQLVSLDQHAVDFRPLCSSAEDAELCDDTWIFLLAVSCLFCL